MPLEPDRLETFGMADIEVMDAATGNLLQVAPGKNLTWTVVLSQDTRSSLATRLDYPCPRHLACTAWTW